MFETYYPIGMPPHILLFLQYYSPRIDAIHSIVYPIYQYSLHNIYMFGSVRQNIR